MQSLHRTVPRLNAFPLTSAALLAAAGCLDGSSVKPPNVDPQAAATYAMERYDANGDGALEHSELSSCPALAAARANFDIDQDGRVSKDELTDALTQIYGVETSLTTLSCTVTFSGRPLAGATVRLRPSQMLGDALPSAEGVTDQHGLARPTIDPKLLPEEFRERPFVYAGLYRVEITHPRTQLAARYNSETELGCYVDPAAHNATSARFDLKPN
jgi:hypothetical protein